MGKNVCIKSIGYAITPKLLNGVIWIFFYMSLLGCRTDPKPLYTFTTSQPSNRLS